MKVLSTIEELNQFKRPTVLTIGNFDGVHCGHLALLNKLKQTAETLEAETVVLSFTNHPVEVLKPGHTVPRLCTLEHKVKLLDLLNLNTLVLTPFTNEFASQTPAQFIDRLKKHCNLKHLLLGHDAVIGKNREGSPTHLQDLAEQQKFSLEYLPELVLEGGKVSSSQIRALIAQGDLKGTEHLLGRPYSIYTTTRAGLGLGKRIGYPTLNFDVEGLCIPPYGVYAVAVIIEDTLLQGVANLGIAPTVRNDNKPLLEVHLLNYQENLVLTKGIEAQFIQFIRPEMRFHNIEELQDQISRDVQKARQIFAEQTELWKG